MWCCVCRVLTADFRDRRRREPADNQSKSLDYLPIRFVVGFASPGGTCRTNSTLYFGLNSCQILNVSIADIEETVPKRFCSKHGTQPFCLRFGLRAKVNSWFCKPRRDLPDEQQPVFWTHSCQISMHFHASVDGIEPVRLHRRSESNHWTQPFR